MIAPEAVEAALRPWMERNSAVRGALVIDLGEQTVIAALLPPGIDAAKIAAPIYKAWRVREELFALVQNNGRDMLFWGDHYAYAIRTSENGVLLMAALLILPANLGPLLSEMGDLLHALAHGG
ncbi:hypothetical protein HC776_03430 [bacterium]|nr:hypothetical protein [bacterium]